MPRPTARPLLPLIFALLLAGCGTAAPPENAGHSAPQPHAANAAPHAADSTASNLLRVDVDGVPWAADQNFFGAVSPPGFGTIVVISGSLGPKDANEQTFTLNLHGIDTPGRYRVHSGDVTSGVAQLIGLSEQNYMIGGILGYDLQVDLTVAQKDPVRIEAQFEGTMMASSGSTVRFSGGQFRYRE